jgi:hypothetical protein
MKDHEMIDARQVCFILPVVMNGVCSPHTFTLIC